MLEWLFRRLPNVNYTRREGAGMEWLHGGILTRDRVMFGVRISTAAKVCPRRRSVCRQHWSHIEYFDQLQNSIEKDAVLEIHRIVAQLQLTADEFIEKAQLVFRDARIAVVEKYLETGLDVHTLTISLVLPEFIAEAAKEQYSHKR